MHILITGVNSGLGKAFFEEALKRRFDVTGTVRNHELVESLNNASSDNAFVTYLDLNNEETIPEAVESAFSRFGGIDVLINCAGYAVGGIFEETAIKEMKAQFQANVFGTMLLTQLVIPTMRERRAGKIVFVSSMAGIKGFGGLSAYSGSKHAIEGIADSLNEELATFSINVTCIEPGAFRTNWAGHSMKRKPHIINDYKDHFPLIEENGEKLASKAPGDPTRAAGILFNLLENNSLPRHLVLGEDAYETIGTEIANLNEDLTFIKANSFETEISHE